MPRPKKTPVAATAALAYVLRTCTATLTSHGGFQWPESGPVEAPDWSSEAVCGYGLHGLLNGEGDGALLSWEPDAKWLVVEVPTNSIINLGKKVKFPRGVVVYCGTREGAVAFLIEHGAVPARMIGGQASATGYGGQASATGYGGQASATGDGGQASATGYGGQASATGVRGQASATGDGGQASATGDGGQASATGVHSLALATEKVAAADKGIIAIRYWDKQAERYRLKVGYVGEEGIEPFFWYDLDGEGNWRKGEPIPEHLKPKKAAA